MVWTVWSNCQKRSTSVVRYWYKNTYSYAPLTHNNIIYLVWLISQLTDSISDFHLYLSCQRHKISFYHAHVCYLLFFSVTDLVAEIQTRFVVAIKPGVGKSMTLGSHHPEPQSTYPCSQCDRKFTTSEGLHEHTKIHVVAADNDMHSATQRLHSLSSNAELRASTKRSQSGSAIGIQCYMCDAILPDRNSFTKHLKSHSSEHISAIKCVDCSQLFASTDSLRRHMMNRECFLMTDSERTTKAQSKLSVDEEAGLRCSNCRQAFISTEELQQHVRRRECFGNDNIQEGSSQQIAEPRSNREGIHFFWQPLFLKFTAMHCLGGLVSYLMPMMLRVSGPIPLFTSTCAYYM